MLRLAALGGMANLRSELRASKFEAIAALTDELGDESLALLLAVICEGYEE